MKRVIVLGGGIAGLAAARAARLAGASVVLVEKNPELGGFTRSIPVDGWIFDYAGHFLHLSRVQHPLQLGQGCGEWRHMPRRAGCWVNGSVIEAPFQYHVRHLPEPVRTECIEGLQAALAEARDFRPEPGENLDSFFRRTFGEGITRHFLRPYNEKLLARSISDFPADRLNRFFPFPDPDALRRSLDADSAPEAYNAFFWYPARGGIGKLVRQLDAGTDFLRGRVDAVDPGERLVRVGNTTQPWDALVSTIPLPELLQAGPEKWREKAKDLSASGVAVFQLGVSGPPADVLREWHWLYVADPALPFFRIGVYSNVSPDLAPRGCHGLYVEVGFSMQAPPDWNALAAHVLGALQTSGFVESSRIEVMLRHVLFPAYVHFDDAWERLVPSFRKELEAKGIFSAGRYGTWDYIGMEDAIFQGEEAARRSLQFSLREFT